MSPAPISPAASRSYTCTPLCTFSNRAHTPRLTTRSRIASCDDTIVLGLGHNGINVGDSKTLYNDVTVALLKLCPVADNYCIKKTVTFPVWISVPAVSSPYRRIRQRKSISVTVLDAKWGGRQNVHDLMTSTIAAAFERGTYDPENCFAEQIPGEKDGKWRDCMTTDYAEIFLSNSYKMKVRFQGPSSWQKNLNWECNRELDDMYQFLRKNLPWKAVTYWIYCLKK